VPAAARNAWLRIISGMPTDWLDAEVRESARSGPAGQPGYSGSLARFTPWISAGRGTVNAMPTDCRMPW
jgi:hypothetical protein